MSAQSQLEIVLKARDDASKAISALQKELDKLGGISQKTQKSSSSLFNEVFKGVAAYDLLRKAVSFTFSSMKEGMVEAMKDQRTIAQTKALLESQGLAWNKVGKEVTAFGFKMLKFGVDNEASQLSVAKLSKALKGDVPQAMKLTKLAADLTSSGFGTLEENVNNIQKVLLGRGQKALMSYGVSLRDNATITEQLAAIQGKATLTIEDYIKTTEGQVKVVKTFANEVKTSLGEGFLMSFSKMIQEISGVSGELSSSQKAMEQFQKVGYMAGQSLVVAINLVRVAIQGIKGAWQVWVSIFSTTIAGILKGVELVAVAMSKVKLVSKDTVESIANLRKGFEQTAEEMGDEAIKKNHESMLKLGDSVLNVVSGFDKVKQETDKANEALKKAQESSQSLTQAESELNDKLQESREAFSNLGKEATKTLFELKDKAKVSIEQTRDKLKELDKQYSDTTKDSLISIDKLSKESSSKLKDIDISIAQTVKEMSNLQKEFDRQKGTDARELAEKFVAVEEKIKDLNEELKKATDINQIAEIKAQIKEQENALDKTKDTQIQFATEITNARKRAGMTDLEREISDYQEKRNLAQEEFSEKMSRLQQERTELQAKRQQEIIDTNNKILEIKNETAEKLKAINEEKQALLLKHKEELELMVAQTTAINEIIQQAQDFRAKATADATAKDISSIELEITQYKKLEEAIRSAYAVKAISQIGATPFARPVSGIGRDTGGSIPTSGLYRLHAGEYVLPKRDVGGVGGVVVNINGGTYLSQEAAEKIGDLIIDKLKTNSRI